MKKIIVTKTETASSVAHKLLGTMEREVTLVIPKQSKVGSSLNNLHLLHREAEKAGKHLVVESVDEEVLAFAKLAGIASSHPFLGRVSGLQDIVPRMRERTEEQPPRHFRASGARDIVPEQQAEEDSSSLSEEEESGEEDEVTIRPQSRRRFSEQSSRSSGHRLRGFLIAMLIVVIAVGGVWAVGAFFSSASVSVRLETIPWNYQGVFIADAAALKVDAAQKVLPAQIFSLNRNLTQSFPGTGTESVKESARGTIVIYNSYSSTPQTLVATTRFVAQDGKIFRLADKVVVPGALVRNGAITPASTTVVIIADKPGEEYNVGPVAKLTIPAFRGSPKFNGFYGAIPGGVKGGYIGVKKVATPKDVETAKTRTTEILKASLENLFATTKPEGFMVAEGGVAIAVKKIAANTSTDASGNFNVFGEAVLTAPGFREDDLKGLLREYAEAERGAKNLMFRSLALDAKAGTFDGAARRAVITVNARGVLAPVFSGEGFRASIVGLGVRDAQAAIGHIQGLSEGKISIWPFWVQEVPSDERRITIAVE